MIQLRTKQLYRERELISEYLKKFSIKSKNPFKFFINRVKYSRLKKRFDTLTNDFEHEVIKPFSDSLEQVKELKDYISFREQNFDSHLNEETYHYASKIEFVKSLIEQNKPLLIGALGEHKAIEELSKLPSSFTVLNDIFLKFFRPIYNRKEDDRIYSIQIDHLVIGPSSIFIVETKNWSEQSVNSLDLFSPVQQIKRSGYALFTVLNSAISKGSLRVQNHHWGDRKISVRNVLLMISAKPRKEFQFVKILSLNQINSYINYLDKTFSSKEISSISSFINNFNLKHNSSRASDYFDELVDEDLDDSFEDYLDEDIEEYEDSDFFDELVSDFKEDFEKMKDTYKKIKRKTKKVFDFFLE
ncbi:MAG: NERD domain-containing protein [Candidatus Heimdallarchaeota archaeon]|nr:NERD domain-containing protein [Candidatus Heimdallarchaeota archaeon]MCK4612911.1 NERD domain-containing protein [Candidatus Heimdallarchaeota archaeon]